MILAAAYLGVLLLLAIFAVHRITLVALWARRRTGPTAAPGQFAAVPLVTVQLPIYNERNVVERLLQAVARLDWPRDRLEIQLLDDSTDDTAEVAAREVAALRAAGFAASHVRRADRRGFKAGALAHGLAAAGGELVLVLDADFVPPADLLRRTVDHFTDPSVGMVQVRWEHLNRGDGALTQAQALLLDAHFVIEQGARHAAGLYFNFNGTAGVWRRAAIEAAGGWSHDTLTEDLDLSYRALQAGWRFVYLPDVAAPAELPADMAAFKSQQFRWAKGSLQVARKLLPALLRRRDVPWRVKREAIFHLLSNVTYPLLLALSLLLAPAALLAAPSLAAIRSIDVAIGLLTLVSLATYYVTSQAERGGRWAAVGRLPLLMAIGAGLCVNQARAVIEGLCSSPRRPSEFVRTPKRGAGGGTAYRVARGWTPIVELGLAAYHAAAAVLAVRAGAWQAVPFLLLFAVGFAWVGGASLLPSPGVSRTASGGLPR